MSATYQKSVLPSGITVLSERMPDRRSVSVGVWVRHGARDEPPEWLGISHLIEHMMFKGTERRDARAIAQSLESLGGHMDAFTGREQVCYYARSLADHLPDVVDVLADIVCRSRFAADDVAREKRVVREEISAAEDSPDDRVSEMLSEQVWGGHPLGRPILGTMRTLEGLTPDTLRSYFASRYRAENLVVAGAGGLDHDELAALVDRHFDTPTGAPLPLSGDPPGFEPGVRYESRDDLQQLYLSLATRGTRYAGDDRYPLIVLNTLLGGGMSSRLFQSVREEAGLAYAIFSSADFHRDAGMLSVHLGVAPDCGREALDLVRRELETLRRDGPTADEVDAARAQLRGSILMGQESVSNRMYHLAGEELYMGHHTTPEQHAERVAAVTLDQVADVAGRYLVPSRFTVAALGPDGPHALDASVWEVERDGRPVAG